jgi:hypothetical protein
MIIGSDRRKGAAPKEFTDDLLTTFSGGSRNDIDVLVAEGEGFEPPDLSINGFQDRRLKPLGHPSKSRS